MITSWEKRICVFSSLWYEIKDKENTWPSIIGNLPHVMVHSSQVNALSYVGG